MDTLETILKTIAVILYFFAGMTYVKKHIFKVINAIEIPKQEKKTNRTIYSLKISYYGLFFAGGSLLVAILVGLFIQDGIKSELACR